MPETAVVEVPQTSTPASSPTSSGTPSPAATPATSAATPAAPASERPKDAAALSKFMQAHEAADATTPQSPLVADSAAAPIAQPASDGPAGAIPNAKEGPIPFDVHHKSLANARTNAVSEYRTQQGWAADVPSRLTAAGVSQQDFSTWVQQSRALAADPVKFITDKLPELLAHPTYGPQIRSAAGRTLSAQTPAAPRQDVQILNDKNEVVGTLSEILAAERQELMGVVQPLLTERQQREQRDADQRRQAAVETHQKQLNAAADGVMATIDGILRVPKDATAETKNALYAKVDAEMRSQPTLRAEHAALAVFERDILPTLQASAEATALDTQRKKAAGNTANGTGASTPLKIGPGSSAKDLAAFMAANPGV